MRDEMSYFLVTEISIACNNDHKMNVNFPIETIFVICNENEIDCSRTISDFYQFKNISLLRGMDMEEMPQIILDHCKSFAEEKAIFIDQGILPREKCLYLHRLLSQNSSQIKSHVYFSDFQGNQEEQDFIEIKAENNDPMLFDQLQNFDDILKKDLCI
jgi:hypothetical protein